MERNERQATCEHRDLYWYSARGAPNEGGWQCVNCDLRPGEPPGYSPAHDRSHLRTKVWSILHDLVNAGIVYVSNSDHGESLTDAATSTAEASGNLDQYSIALAILSIMAPSHAVFWRERGEAIVAGRDDRERCACGALANVFTSGGGKPSTAWCSTCSSKELRKEGDGGPF